MCVMLCVAYMLLARECSKVYKDCTSCRFVVNYYFNKKPFKKKLFQQKNTIFDSLIINPVLNMIDYLLLPSISKYKQN